MAVYISGMGPLEYNGLDLGYYSNDEQILSFEDKNFRSAYKRAKKEFSNNFEAAEKFIINVEKNFLKQNLCKWGFLRVESASYKAARKVLMDESLKEFNVLDYIAKQELIKKEFLDDFLHC